MTAPGGAALDGAADDLASHLVVVGAGAGMGRWLIDHLLLQRAWESVTLVDADPSSLAEFAGRSDLTIAAPPGVGDVSSLAVDRAGVAVVVAVPESAIAGVLTWLTPALAPDATIGVVTAHQRATLDTLTERWPSDRSFGIHPLFDASARSVEGQTLLIVGDDGVPAGRWLEALIADAGAISDSGTAAAHDAIMTYVQTMAHQSLVTFADAVTSSGLNLQNVWEARTPVFEALFGLAARVLAEKQQATIADLQIAMGGVKASDELAVASARWSEALADGSTDAVEAHVAEVRDRFSGALFETVQATAASAVAATQAKRADLARHRRTGALVGVRPVGKPNGLRVGRIVEVTPVSVTLREVMFGKRGSAALVDGPGRHNAARLGINRRPDGTQFGLGHVDVLVGDELDAALDEWLAFIRRDVRFLVPESVAGAGVLTIVAAHPAVRGAEVVSEVVRTGQRAVALRVHVRADHDVDDMVEALRAHVQATYEWPAGTALTTDATHVHYLGPPGTFAEAAAKQARVQAGRETIVLEPQPDFPAVLSAVGRDQLGVLPISSSASGLVTRAVRALLDHPDEVVFGGVVDVAVRIDAFVADGRTLGDLRGARVVSHPQALGQCQGFIKRWQLVAEPCASTAEALLIARDDPDGCVALAGAGFDTPVGVRVAEREVDDLSGSITRFLIVGGPDTFGDLTGGWDPTLRSLWVADSLGSVLDLIGTGGAAFDELLTDQDGRCLWVTSRVPDAGVAPTDGVRYLGRAPWSPRTPVVRVEVDVPRG